MINWRVVVSDMLNNTVEAQKAAKRAAEKAADAVISAWLERAVEIAQESSSVAIFNEQMRRPYHMLGERETDNIRYTLEDSDPHTPPLIGRLREELLEYEKDFAFPVVIEPDVKFSGRYYIVAIPDYAD